MIRTASSRQHSTRLILYSWLFVLTVGLYVASPVYAAENVSNNEDSGQVMQGFTDLSKEKEKSKEMSDKKKHIILFTMGISLVILVLTTAGLGLAMVLYRKPVFVAHMIFAGMTVTLALVHALAAMIWFFPF
jgi:hypothetical protein